jgi:hypothetical protein
MPAEPAPGIIAGNPPADLGSGVLPGLDEDDEDGEVLFLNPCYELIEQHVQTPQGPGLKIVTTPCFHFASGVPVMFPNPDLIIEVGDLEENDRRVVVEWVAQGEAMKKELRARRSTLVR